ncbi:hypothetical protein BDR26DRAFT_932028 [Obelidium mucronatum]|nr:hypothetical protein BDR26DRAFT_932028 [Obelidium mucronatum]
MSVEPSRPSQSLVPAALIADGIHAARSSLGIDRPYTVIPIEDRPQPSAPTSQMAPNHPLFYIDPDALQDGHRILASIQCPTQSSSTFSETVPPTLAGRIPSSVYSIRIQEINKKLNGRIEFNDYSQLWYLLVVGYLILGVDLAMWLTTSGKLAQGLSATIMIPIIPVAFLSRYLAKRTPKYIREIEKCLESWNKQDAPLNIKTILKLDSAPTHVFGMILVIQVLEEVNMEMRMPSSDTVGRNSFMIRVGRPSLGLPGYSSPTPGYHS